MFDTSRDPTEELRRQWNMAQERALGVFPQAQARADRNQERDDALRTQEEGVAREEARFQTQRNDALEGVAREEARFQTQRDDALSADARTIARQQLADLEAGLAELDPDDPEDAPVYRQGVEATQRLREILGMTGRNALSALVDGTIGANGQPRFIGEAVAAVGSRATGASNRREDVVAEAKFQHDREMTVMGFEFTAEQADEQRQFEDVMAQAERDLRNGMQIRDVAASMRETLVGIGFQREQGALERALAQEIESGRIDLETRKLDFTESDAEASKFAEAIAGLDVSIPEDAARLEVLMAEVATSGMRPSHVAGLWVQAAAAGGEGNRQRFAATGAEIANITAGTALLTAQEAATTYATDRKAVEDGVADSKTFSDFIVNTAAMGRMGSTTLKVMLQHFQEGREDSPYAPYFDQIDEDVLQAAIDKADEVATDQTLDRNLWQMQTRTALLSQVPEQVAAAASFMGPEDLRSLMDAADDDPMFSQPDGRGTTLRMLRDDLRNTPGLLASAERRAGLRLLEENSPRIASATNDLSFYAQQRPDDIEAGKSAVRNALGVLASNGLFGDPNGDETLTAQMIEDQVSFYTRAWGDGEKMFDAELAEMASRTALNAANSRRLAASLSAGGGAGGGAGAIDFERLEFYRDTVDGQIDAAMDRAETLGCGFSAMIDRATAPAGQSPICEAIADEIAGYQTDYNNIIRDGGYTTPDERAMSAWVESNQDEIERTMPGATPEQMRGELERRYAYYAQPFVIGVESAAGLAALGNAGPTPAPTVPEWRPGAIPRAAGAVGAALESATAPIAGAVGNFWDWAVGSPAAPAQPGGGGR